MMSGTADNRPAISVIIPCFNAGEKIISCLDSIAKASEGLDVEIIVVDSSDDRTKALLENREDIVLLRSERRLLPGEARNVGVQRASGRIICFTDADCLADPDWLSLIFENRPDVLRVALGGAILNGTPRDIVGAAEYFSEFSAFLPGMPRKRVRFLPTANLAVSVEDFNLCGGFQEFEKGSDVAFGEACARHGIPIVFDPRIRVTHRNRTQLRHFLSNQEMLGAGAGATRTRFRMRGSILVRIPPLWMFLPFVRFARILWRSLLHGKGQRLLFLKSSPFIFLGTLYYARGLVKSVIRSTSRGKKRASAEKRLSEEHGCVLRPSSSKRAEPHASSRFEKT